MTLLNMQLAQEALKTYYLPVIRYQMNEKSSPFYAKIEKTSKNVVGKDIKLVMKYGRHGGIGNRADDGTLPTPNSRKVRQATWTTKNIFGRIQLTDKLIKASKGKAGAFANILEAELEELLADAKDNFARQLFGDGTGVLATLSAGTGVNTLTVSSTRFFAEGQYVDILSSDGQTTIASEREITVVDHVNKTITIDGTAVTVSDGDIVVISGNYGNELTGLDAIFDLDSTLYGIDRSTNKWLNPNKINVGGELSELVIQQGIDQAEQYAGGNIDFIICSYGVRRAYIYLLQSQKRIVNTIELKGGFKALTYNGIPVIADKYQAPGVMDLLSTENFTLNRIDDWDWLDKDGAILSRMADKAAYEATLVLYADLGCDKPKAQTRLYGITEH
ncbi:MAG: phage major capsid protein [Thermosipho sp. (in: Bacteria)]|nr:phage major capsid protein [Thermosipho sp. (in: thermotogales)]